MSGSPRVEVQVGIWCWLNQQFPAHGTGDFILVGFACVKLPWSESKTHKAQLVQCQLTHCEMQNSPKL